MEAPAQLAGVDVITPHVAAGAARGAVCYQAADNQCACALRDGRRQAVAACGILREVGGSGTQDSAIGEITIELARLAVDRKQRACLAAEQQSLGIALPPVAEAAVDVQVEAARPIQLRVELPQLLSRSGVESEQAIKRGGHVERAVNHQRCRFEGGSRGSAAETVREIRGVKLPSDLQAAYVVRRDLVQRGVARAAGIVAVVAPLLGRQWRQQDGQAQREQCRAHQRIVARAKASAGATIPREGTPVPPNQECPDAQSMAKQ